VVSGEVSGEVCVFCGETFFATKEPVFATLVHYGNKSGSLGGIRFLLQINRFLLLWYIMEAKVKEVG
jgi:hypothetical protein